MFGFVEERSSSAALDLTYHLAPWDRPVFSGNTAVISAIKVRPKVDPGPAFESFRNWCRAHDVRLVSCRLPQDHLAECGFLEAQGFRFIELNYRPTLVGLERFSDEQAISVRPALPSDAAEITDFAGRIFDTGRLHVDPQVGADIGNRRYAAWAANAFENPAQNVLKCVMDGRTVAFMVVEQPTATSRFWSLVGLAPGLTGQRLGKRVWRAVLAFHHREGVREVSTSVSSHNTAAINLYVSLHFRFPSPTITLHWCPFGPLRSCAS